MSRYFHNFWRILFRNNVRMTQYSTNSQKFTYVVVGQIKTAWCTKCTKSAVIRHEDTRNQWVAKLSINHYIGPLFYRETEGLHVNSMIILFKISPLSFLTCVTRNEMASPLFDSCSNMSVVQLMPIPQLADVFNSWIFTVCVWCTFSCIIPQKE